MNQNKALKIAVIGLVVLVLVLVFTMVNQGEADPFLDAEKKTCLIAEIGENTYLDCEGTIYEARVYKTQKVSEENLK